MATLELNITLNGVTYTVEVEKVNRKGGTAPAAPAPAAATVQAAAPAPAPVQAAPKAAPAQVAAGDTPVTAPMPGKVVKVMVKEGAKVKKGDVLMLLEAMKMQNEIGAPCDGVVKSVNVAGGQGVKPGEVMAVIG